MYTRDVYSKSNKAVTLCKEPSKTYSVPLCEKNIFLFVFYFLGEFYSPGNTAQ